MFPAHERRFNNLDFVILYLMLHQAPRVHDLPDQAMLPGGFNFQYFRCDLLCTP